MHHKFKQITQSGDGEFRHSGQYLSARLFAYNDKQSRWSMSRCCWQGVRKSDRSTGSAGGLQELPPYLLFIHRESRCTRLVVVSGVVLNRRPADTPLPLTESMVSCRPSDCFRSCPQDKSIVPLTNLFLQKIL